MSENFEFQKRNYAVRRAGVVVLVLALAIGAGFLVKQLFEKEDPRKKNVVHQITLVKPPPPPPPPPKEEKPPEIKKEEVKIEEQKPQEAPPEAAKPPGEQLGLDADGSAGSDGFGLAARKGGQDLVGGGGGSKHGWYAGLIQSHLQEQLARNKKLRGQDFRAVIHVWLRPDGSVQRAELVGSSGKPDTDELIRLAVAEVQAVREPPPSDLPQPVRLRVTNRI